MNFIAFTDLAGNRFAFQASKVSMIRTVLEEETDADKEIIEANAVIMVGDKQFACKETFDELMAQVQ